MSTINLCWFAFFFFGAISRFVGISVACDICGKAFGAQPANIIPCYTLEDWEDNPQPGDEPSQYVFVCQVCEPQVVHFYESDD